MNARFASLLLVVAIGVAQWAGLAHRVEHRQWLETGSVLAPAYGSSQQPADRPAHDCAAWDAQSVADTPAAARVGLPVLPDDHGVAFHLASTSPLAAKVLRPPSQAPPLS